MSAWGNSGRRRLLAGVALAIAMAAPPAVHAAGPGDGSATSNPQLLDAGAPCASCAARPTYTSGDPPWDIDWSLALRGVTKAGDDSASYEGEIAPTFAITQQTLRGGYDASGSARVVVNADGVVRLDELAATASGRYDLDEWSALDLRGSLTAGQDAPGTGTTPDTIAEAPLELGGELEATASRRLGGFTLALRGTVGRTSVGDTTYLDNSTASNGDRSATTAGLGGRLSVDLGPRIVLYVDGNSDWSRFDAASTTLLAKRDARTDTVIVGVDYAPDALLKLGASLGAARQDFVDPALADFVATLVGASATFTPDEALTLAGGITTTIAPSAPSTTSTASVATASTGSIAALVNPWLRLRGSAGLTHTVLQPSGSVTDEWTAGLGADYLFNTMTDLTADYGFTRTLADPAPPADVHRLTLGVTFHR